MNTSGTRRDCRRAAIFLRVFPLAVAVASVQLPAYTLDSTTPSQSFQQQPSSTRSPAALLDEGVLLYQAARHDEAIQAWQAALLAYEEANDTEGMGKALGNLGVAHRALGRYSQAIDYYQQALAIQQDFNDVHALSYTLGNLGNIKAVIGQYDQAIDYQKRGLVLAQTLQDLRQERIAISNLGAIYADKGDYEQAIAHYQEGLEIARSLEDPISEAHILINLASAHNIWRKDHRLAIEYYQKCLDLLGTEQERWLQAEALSGMGFAYEGLKDFEAAFTHYNQGLAIFEAMGSYQSAAVTLNNKAHSLLVQWSEHRESTDIEPLLLAEESLRQSIDFLNTVRNDLDVDRDRISLFETQVATYNLLQQVLIAKGDIESALVASEEGRSRAFSTLLAENLDQTNDNISISQIQQFAQQQQTTVVEYTLVPEDDFIHQGQRQGKAAILYIWIVSPTGKITFRSVDLKNDKIDLAADILLSLSTIGVRSRSFELAVENSEIAVGQEAQLQVLYEALINPIEDLLAPLEEMDPVVFIPQGELFSVPFAALRDLEGNYLIEKHTILTAPSIQVMQLAQQHNRPVKPLSELTGEDFLIVGNPDMPEAWDSKSSTYRQLPILRGAQIEAETVADFFAGQPLLQGAATERLVRQQMPQARVIHLATHGLLEYGSPSDSGVDDVPGAIALTPDNEYDGLLTSAEISTLDLKADLVVLSACDTGLGQITGDGVIGLARSLMGAGASSVVVSLWSVPDAPTAELMTEFYRQLKQGETKAQALRQAMLETMKTHQKPSDWAAFTVMGDPS